ncbi:MAG: glycosyltransferase family 2 protein [bacterium]|nr:glycosyltransferase family 2 protein [bacterium]
MSGREFINSIKKKEIKVSVIVPVYNTGKYLERCLESIVFQTLNDIEIIIVNDGSVDNSAKIIEKFLPDKRVIYIKQENKGQGAARNKGLGFAKGEYISFIDSDDYIDNDFLEKLYKAAERNQADIAASSIIRKRETFEKWRILYEKTSVKEDLNEIFKAVNYPDQSYVWNKLYKKSFLDSINFKFEENVYYEDVTALSYILLNCKKLVCVSDTNYYYMVNDGNSIVKGKKTVKKETDRYNNQKSAVKKLVEKGVKIPRGEYFIKKSEYKISGIPILKIKEDLLLKKELFLLFNLIPFAYLSQDFLLKLKLFFKRLFSISNVDGHILIFLLFVKLNIKYKTKISAPEIKELGINLEEREKKIIASLTTFPERINSVSKTIKTLMNQTVKADEIVLWLAEEQFKGKENSLPSELKALKEYGLQIKWTNDIKSYKKLIPALKEYPDDIIITFDDDIYYEKDTIEVLYNSYLKNKNEIQANRTWRIELKNDKIRPLDSSCLIWNYEEYKEASFLNTIIGCGGVLYPPHSLCEDVLDESKFTEIVPTQDDIWFWGMALLNGTKIRLNKGYSYNHITVENTQNFGLCKINNRKQKGISGKDGFNRFAEYYPEILEILKKEK